MTIIHILPKLHSEPDTTKIPQLAQAGSRAVPITCLDMPGPPGAQKQEAAREEQKVPTPTLVESRLG